MTLGHVFWSETRTTSTDTFDHADAGAGAEARSRAAAKAAKAAKAGAAAAARRRPPARGGGPARGGRGSSQTRGERKSVEVPRVTRTWVRAFLRPPFALPTVDVNFRHLMRAAGHLHVHKEPAATSAYLACAGEDDGGGGERAACQEHLATISASPGPLPPHRALCTREKTLFPTKKWITCHGRARWACFAVRAGVGSLGEDDPR